MVLSSLMGHHWRSPRRWPISGVGHWERVLKDEKEPARHKVGKEQLTRGKNRAQGMYLERGGIWIGSWRMGEVAVDTEIRPIMGTSTSLLILGKFFSSPGLNFFFYEIERFKWMIPMEELRWEAGLCSRRWTRENQKPLAINHGHTHIPQESEEKYEFPWLLWALPIHCMGQDMKTL